jgi:hypothetical protein
MKPAGGELTTPSSGAIVAMPESTNATPTRRALVRCLRE